jgi:electron transport complex protein RnfA
VIMAGLRESIDFADVPQPLRGIPIALFVATILAMAFAGFAGMGSP